MTALLNKLENYQTELKQIASNLPNDNNTADPEIYQRVMFIKKEIDFIKAEIGQKPELN